MRTLRNEISGSIGAGKEAGEGHSNGEVFQVRWLETSGARQWIEWILVWRVLFKVCIHFVVFGVLGWTKLGRRGINRMSMRRGK